MTGFQAGLPDGQLSLLVLSVVIHITNIQGWMLVVYFKGRCQTIHKVQRASISPARRLVVLLG